MRIYLPTEQVPKNRLIYGIYMVEGHSTPILRCLRFLTASPIFADVEVKEGETYLCPVGFVIASDLVKLIKENTTVSLQSLAELGKRQAMWYKPKEK